MTASRPQRLPPAALNLDRLQAGVGVTLANPVQHILLTVASLENPLRGSHVAAMLRCMASAWRKDARNVVGSG